MADLIDKKDSLNKGRGKLNEAIEQSNEALNTANDADQKADEALSNSESTQDQLDQVVIDGDSSVEAAQARVNERGTTFDTLKERIDDLDLEFESRAVNVTWFGVIGDGQTDNTQAFNDIIQNLDEHTILHFPYGTYVGNFVSDKSFIFDGNGSTFIPFSSDQPVIHFDGSDVLNVDTTHQFEYGETDIQLTDSSNIEVGDIGYFVDEMTRSSDGKLVNYELVKIVDVNHSDNTITVADQIRSYFKTGTVTFSKIDPLKSPRVKDVTIDSTADNTFASVWFSRVINPLSQNITVNRGIGHAVRHEYTYNPKTENIIVNNPRETTSGRGYGVTFHKSRVCKAENIYGEGCRHIVDSWASYDVIFDGIKEVNGYASSPVLIAHNGYGGKIHVDNVVVSSDHYAVSFGLPNEPDKFICHDVKVDNVNHFVPNQTPDQQFVSVYIQPDVKNTKVDNISVHFKNTDVDPTSSSSVVRFNGDQLGGVSVNNIRANSIGTLVRTTGRTSSGVTEIGDFTVNNLSADKALYGVRLRNARGVTLDNVFIDTILSNGHLLSIDGDTSLYYLNVGDNVYVRLLPDELIHIENSLVDGLLRGKQPQLNLDSTSMIDLTSSNQITRNRILDSGDLLRAKTPIESNVTLDSVTPIEPPIWLGQSFHLLVNITSTSARGNIVIPTGSDTVTDYGTDITLEDGHIYKFVGYGSKWVIEGI